MASVLAARISHARLPFWKQSKSLAIRPFDRNSFNVHSNANRNDEDNDDDDDDDDKRQTSNTFSHYQIIEILFGFVSSTIFETKNCLHDFLQVN